MSCRSTRANELSEFSEFLNELKTAFWLHWDWAPLWQLLHSNVTMFAICRACCFACKQDETFTVGNFAQSLQVVMHPVCISIRESFFLNGFVGSSSLTVHGNSAKFSNYFVVPTTSSAIHKARPEDPRGLWGSARREAHWYDQLDSSTAKSARMFTVNDGVAIMRTQSLFIMCIIWTSSWEPHPNVIFELSATFFGNGMKQRNEATKLSNEMKQRNEATKWNNQMKQPNEAIRS